MFHSLQSWWVDHGSCLGVYPRECGDDFQRTFAHEVTNDIQVCPIRLGIHPSRCLREVRTEQWFVRGHVCSAGCEHNTGEANLCDNERTKQAWLAATVERGARQHLP